MNRTGLSRFDHLAILIISTVSWVLMISGALFCLDAFLPKSHPVPAVWSEFIFGVAIWAAGHGLRIIRRRSF